MNELKSVLKYSSYKLNEVLRWELGGPIATPGIKRRDIWDFPGGAVVKNCLAIRGTWVPSLPGELRSHVPCSN